MKRRMDDGCTIYTYTIYCAHCCTVYVGLAQARPNNATSKLKRHTHRESLPMISPILRADSPVWQELGG